MHSKWANLIPIIAALSAGAEAATAKESPLRKTVSFGPQLGHAKYTTSPAHLSTFTTTSNDKKSVFKLADEYVKTVLGHPEGSWKLREDSYLDENTGVWHLYLRQVMHDGNVEVTDGDINLNVLNGKVISYGDSVSCFGFPRFITLCCRGTRVPSKWIGCLTRPHPFDRCTLTCTRP